MSKANILLVEDDEIMRVTLHDRLKEKGWQVDAVENGGEALARLETHSYHLAVSDIRMPVLDGSRLLDAIRQQAPDTDVILMTAYGSVSDAVACLKRGASDYVLKPFDPDDLIIRIERLLEVQAIKARCSSLEENCRYLQTPIVGSGPAIRSLLNLIGQVATTDATVLITGESGTGKELVAAALHNSSNRAAGPYIRVNCAAIPDGLMESELFGHEKGAFTGAVNRQVGRFERADGGTILLDEIGDMPLHLQAKLLRVLEDREVERVGGRGPVKIDVRILCATARDLAREVEKNNFREDLYYRLRVIPIEVPSLRKRKEDIPELCAHFLNRFGQGRAAPLRLSGEALEVLMGYDYPGNVRELKNILERLSVLAPAPVIQPWHLPADLNNSASPPEENTVVLTEAVARAEKQCILKALTQSGGNKTRTAELLGISRKNLWEKMKQHRIE